MAKSFYKKLRKIKAILVNCPIPQLDDDRRQAPGGLVYIATYAAKQGFDVEVCDLAGFPLDGLVQRIPRADVFAFSTYTVTYYIILHLVAELKLRYPHAIFVAGGPHATALPHEVAQNFDYVVVGEGEEAFSAILEHIQQGTAERLPQVIHAAPICDLNKLPFPDYQRFCDLLSYTRRLGALPVVCLDSSRGCRNRCRFCNSCVHETGTWRPRSPENVFAEVSHYCHLGFHGFRFNDDNFSVDTVRTMRLCQLLRPLQIKFRIFARAEDLCHNLIASKLKEAGCVHVAVGIESLSPSMLARMGKATRVDRIRLGLQRARDAGLGVRGYFLVGFPGETDATVAESIEALVGLPLDEAVVYPTIPYPGTDLFKRPGHYGINFIDPDYSRFVQIGKKKSTGFVMCTETFGLEDVRKWRDLYMRAFSELGIYWADEQGDVI